MSRMGYTKLCNELHQTTTSQTHYNDREDRHHNLSDENLLLITFIKNILLSWLYVILLLRFTKIISILLAYKLKSDFCQNLWNVQIFIHYITKPLMVYTKLCNDPQQASTSHNDLQQPPWKSTSITLCTFYVLFLIK